LNICSWLVQLNLAAVFVLSSFSWDDRPAADGPTPRALGVSGFPGPCSVRVLYVPWSLFLDDQTVDVQQWIGELRVIQAIL